MLVKAFLVLRYLRSHHHRIFLIVISFQDLRLLDAVICLIFEDRIPAARQVLVGVIFLVGMDIVVSRLSWNSLGVAVWDDNTLNALWWPLLCLAAEGFRIHLAIDHNYRILFKEAASSRLVEILEFYLILTISCDFALDVFILFEAPYIFEIKRWFWSMSVLAH